MSVCFFPGLMPHNNALANTGKCQCFAFLFANRHAEVFLLFFAHSYSPLCKVVQFSWACLPFCMFFGASVQITSRLSCDWAVCHLTVDVKCSLCILATNALPVTFWVSLTSVQWFILSIS